MTVHNNHTSTGLGGVVSRIGRTALRGINTRVELLALEWQEERIRLRSMLLWAAALMFLITLGALLLTAAIIFLFPQELRVYVAGAFGLLYLCGALGAGLALKAALKREPFSESINQVKKDRAWLESLE